MITALLARPAQPTNGANPFRLKNLETGAVILPPHQLGKR